MNAPIIRPAYRQWPEYNRRLRDIVAAMTEEQLALRPTAEPTTARATTTWSTC